MTVMIRTRYFQGYELKCKCGCHLLNYDDLFLMKLEVFRDVLGSRLEVTSGCRCKKHNAEVDGVETSLHQATNKKASACDVTPLDTNIENVYKLATNVSFFNEVIWYKKEKFIHLGCDKNQKGNFFQIKE